MRVLLPEPADSPDLHEFYARDWIDADGVRANFIASADGAAMIDGYSKGLQTPGDQAVFRALRDLADVVLVGRGTAETETYRPVVTSASRARTRIRYGFAPVLATAVVSASLDVDLAAPLYAGDPATAPTVLVTCARAGVQRIATARRHVDVIVAGDQAIDFAAVRRELRQRGWPRILTEGGPTLFAAMVAQRAVDELCLSIVPMLAGPGPGRMTAGAPWPAPVDFDLIGLLEEDGALFQRLRARPR